VEIETSSKQAQAQAQANPAANAKAASQLAEITKKELLVQTGISYGQLYRWKREGLIPEEWFVKRSSFTGQETYFPRERILARVNAILGMKDEYSLEEIRKELEGGLRQGSLTETLQLLLGDERDAAEKIAAKLGEEDMRTEACAAVVGAYLAALGEGLSDADAQALAGDAAAAAKGLESRPKAVCLIKAGGKFFALLADEDARIELSQGAEVLARMSVSDLIEQAKARANAPAIS
jgi:DNA-binding transcriptional MerR regulator